jgi:hypothetical protein
VSKAFVDHFVRAANQQRAVRTSLRIETSTLLALSADVEIRSFAGTIRRHLRSIANHHREAAVSPIRLLGTLAAEAPALPSALSKQIASGFDAWSRQIGELVAIGQMSGEIEPSLDPHLFAAFLVNSLLGAIIRTKGDPASGALDEFLRFVFDRLLPVTETDKSDI